jgi:2'-5' RNA ligase
MPPRTDEISTDVKDDLLVAPNFPGVRLKPRAPARGEVVARDGVRHLLKGADHDGVMVALRLPLRVAEAVALPGGEAPWDLHLTLVYLGSASEVGTERLNELHDRIAAVCSRTEPFAGTISGYGRFRPDGDTDVIWAHLDAPELPALRHAVLQAASDSAVEQAGDHGFTPHVTLGYASSDEQMLAWLAEMEARTGRGEVHTVLVDHVSVVMGGTEARIRLRGEPDDDGRSQPVLPPETFSELQRPKHRFDDASSLEEWADGRPLLVRPCVDGVACVVVKRGRDVHVGVEGVPTDARVRLDDLVVAMGRIDHDYALEGYLCAVDLEGDWLGADRIGAVLDGGLVATPVLLPTDVLVVDGDVSGRPARERWELLRALVPEAGGHVVVPVQVECEPPGLGAAVREAAAWQPSDGQGLRVWGVVAVAADSPYVHGPSRNLALLELGTRKGFEFGAGPGAGTERPGQVADGRKKPNFREPSEKGAAPGVFGTPGTAGIVAPEQGVFRRPKKEVGVNIGVGVPLTLVPNQPRQRGRPGSMSPNAAWPAYERKFDPDEPRDDQGQWTGGGGSKQKDPGTMRGAEINRELDALEARSSRNTTAFIDAGRGSEKPSDYLGKDDPLSREARAIYDRTSELRGEIEARWGPGHPSRVPPGSWSKPRVKKDGGTVTGGGTGDGDSNAAPAFGFHTFVVGDLVDGEFRPGKFRRVNPYEAIFLRPAWVGRRSSDASKPRKYPDVGEEMGFSDSYDALYLEKEDMADPDASPLYLSEGDVRDRDAGKTSAEGTLL